MLNITIMKKIKTQFDLEIFFIVFLKNVFFIKRIILRK